MNNDYYSIMDKCLEFILNRKKLTGFAKLTGENTEMDMLRTYITDILKLEFYEQNAIIIQLTEDGLIYDGENCRLSLKGIQFIENGGYYSKNQKDKFRDINQKYINFALIFGGVPAGAYYTI